MFRRRRGNSTADVGGLVIALIVLSIFFPIFKLIGIVLKVGLGLLIAGVVFAVVSKRIKAAEARRAQEGTTAEKQPAEKAEPKKQEPVKKPETAKKSYGPEIDPIVEEGNRALSEMGRLYMSIKDTEVRGKINELMRITDKFVQDAIDDPADIPQIKKFMNYYLPTTIKLLNSYDRMSAQEIEGENLNKSMASINSMLDTAIEAYKKRLDSLFEDQALDIETDIDVLNRMLEREGLTGSSDFQVK